MLSSMSPTIIAKDGQLFMVTGTPGGRTIINTVLTTILNVIDYGMNAQEAVDAGRMHHQWLPDRLSLERFRILRRHDRDAEGDGPHGHRRRQPGRRAGDRLQSEGQHARRRRRSALVRRRSCREIGCLRCLGCLRCQTKLGGDMKVMRSMLAVLIVAGVPGAYVLAQQPAAPAGGQPRRATADVVLRDQCRQGRRRESRRARRRGCALRGAREGRRTPLGDVAART